VKKKIFILFFINFVSLYLKAEMLFEGLEESLKKEILNRYSDIENSVLQQDQAIRFLIDEKKYDYVEILKSNTNETKLAARNRQNIHQFQFIGNAYFSDYELSNLLNTYDKVRYYPDIDLEIHDKILQLYKDNGFPLCIIDLTKLQLDSNRIAIQIKITEGYQSKINEITINSINSDLQKRLSRTVRKKIGSPNTSQNISELNLLIRTFLSENGFYRAQLSEPKIETDKTFQNNKVIFNIDNPISYSLVFNGNTKISSSRLTDILELENYFTSSPSVASDIFTKIKNHYLKNGYSLAEITAEELYTGKSFEKLVKLDVKENLRTRIESFKVSGQLSRDEKFYVDFIQKNASDLIQGGYFNREDLDDVLKKLIIYIQNEGFLKVKIANVRILYNEEKSKVQVHIQIEEGPITTLKELKFIGSDTSYEKKLTELSGLTVNKPIQLMILEQSISKIIKFYQSSGYLEVTVDSGSDRLISYNSDSTEAFVTYYINEGPKVIVDSILIEGNTFTRDKVIQRELDFKIGEVLTPEKIDETTKRLQKLGHFSSVDIRTLEEKTNVSARTVLVKVVERNPGIFNMGLGANSERAFSVRGYLGISYRNIAGTGRGASIRLEGNYNLADVKYLEQKILFGYLEPSVFNSRVRFRTNLSTGKQVSDFNKQVITETTQSLFTLEYDFTQHHSLAYDVFGFAKVKDSQRFGDTSIFPESLQEIATTGPTYTIDYRDHPFNPTRGTLTRFNIEYSSPAIGSTKTIEYWRNISSFTHYYSPWKPGWTLANSFRYGYLQNLSRAADGGVPYDKKGLLLGGLSTIRGFNSGEAFPNQTDLGTERYKLLTTAHMYLIKTELRFPIYSNFGGAVFYDGGAVYIQDPLINIRDPYRDALGVGIRFITPIGPASLEFAYKLDRRDNESQWPLNFSIGTF